MAVGASALFAAFPRSCPGKRNSENQGQSTFAPQSTGLCIALNRLYVHSQHVHTSEAYIAYNICIEGLHSASCTANYLYACQLLYTPHIRVPRLCRQPACRMLHPCPVHHFAPRAVRLQARWDGSLCSRMSPPLPHEIPGPGIHSISKHTNHEPEVYIPSLKGGLTPEHDE